MREHEITGQQYEDICAAYLKQVGFRDIRMTKASRDQGVDLLAKSGRLQYGIQCKYYSRTVGNKAVQEAYAGAAYYGCDAAVVMTNAAFSAPAKELAESNGVLLWEGYTAKYMKKMIRRKRKGLLFGINFGLLLLVCLIVGTILTAAGCANTGSDPNGKEQTQAEQPETSDSQQTGNQADKETAVLPGLIFNTQMNENREYYGGEPGDQTGKETRIHPYPAYYREADYPWSFIMRCTDAEVRDEVIRLAYATAENDNIGYDSGEDRFTMRDEAAKVGYDPGAIEVPCSVNCVSSVLTLYQCAGYRLDIDALKEIDISMHTWEMKEELEKTGMFEVVEGADLYSPDGQRAGDIYVAQSRHVMMQVTDGKDAAQKQAASE